MTPYEIEILLHYHCRASDWDGSGRGNNLYRFTMDHFIDSGLLKKGADDADIEFQSTDRLHVYVEKLCSVRLPEKMWV